MRVLDIDLDFFLSRIADSIERGKRLSENEGFIPWSETQVRKFLELNCALNMRTPIQGSFCVYHHEVFKIWRKLILDKKLLSPFEVVHVDAHADLGLGDASWHYIIGELLHKPVDQRFFPKDEYMEGLEEGNYLAFAVACRWIKKLTYTHHRDCNDDFILYYFKDFDESSGFLQLPQYDLEKLHDPYFYKNYEPLSLEPPVPFEVVNSLEYQSDAPFSFVFLTQSPSYTPPLSDKLIPIIMEYIKEISDD